MDAITSVAPLLACTFNASLSFIINGSVNTCSFWLAVKLTSLSTTKIAAAASTKVTLTPAVLPASSATYKDFTIALEFDGTVYKVVRAVVVKLVFSFLYIFAINLILTK